MNKGPSRRRSKRRRPKIQDVSQRRSRGQRQQFRDRQVKIVGQGYLSYGDYIKSPEWAARRRAYYQRNPRCCAVCDREDTIFLHHLTYVRVGRERDKDLAPLCRRCHLLVHEYPGGGFGFKAVVAMRRAYRRTGDPMTALRERADELKFAGKVTRKSIADLSDEERQRYAIEKSEPTERYADWVRPR